MHNWKNLLKLLASVTAVQLIGFALLPFFSRLYSRADYGILGMLMSFVGLLTPLASMRYDQAALVARSGTRLQLLRVLGVIICLAMTTLLCLACALLTPHLGETKYAVAVPYLYIVPLTVFSSGMFSVLAAGANAEGKYGRISLASLVQGYVNNGLKVLCGWGKMGVWGFAVAFNSGMLIACSILGLRRGLVWRQGLSYYRLKVVAHHYRSFPKYTSLMVVLAMLISNILAMLLPNFYRVEDIGLITMLYMISRRPVQVYAEATGRIYARRLVEARERGEDFRPDMRRVALRLGIIALGAFVLIPYVAEPLIALVLGDEWLMLAPIVLWIVPFLAMEAMNYIFNFIPDVVRRQRAYLVVQALRLLAEVLFIGLLAPRVSFDEFIRYYFLFACAEYALINLWFYSLLDYKR